jgi:hypothetical protein
LVGDPFVWAFTPRGCQDGAIRKVVLPFNIVEVVIDAGVELALAGDKSEDDSIGAGANACFWVDFSKKCWVLGTDGSEGVLGGGGVKFEKHHWSVEDGNTSNCS